MGSYNFRRGDFVGRRFARSRFRSEGYSRGRFDLSRRKTRETIQISR